MNALATALAIAAGPRGAAAARDVVPMLEALNTKNGYSNEHVVAVRATAVMIARRLRLGRSERAALAAAALLHDVGKISVPDAILAKAGPLDPEEWTVMRSHPAAGARLLESFVHDERIVAIVRGHHERWDGNGYPDGLAGTAIPLGARIVAVADAFQAMMEARPYRAAVARPVALDTIRSEAGHQFDPVCVEALDEATASRHLSARPLVTPAL